MPPGSPQRELGELGRYLPESPHAQLELAHRIVLHAHHAQVSQLEADLSSQQSAIQTLERRLADAEAELHEQQARARAAASEQHRLSAEKNALIETVKRLNREVAKLEHFKRNLLQTLQDDSGAVDFAPSLAAVDLTTERLVSEVLQSADGIAAAAAAAAATGQQQQQQHMGSGGGRVSPPRGGAVGSLGSKPSHTSPRSKQYAASSSLGSKGGGGSGGSPYSSRAPPAASSPVQFGAAALGGGARGVLPPSARGFSSPPAAGSSRPGGGFAAAGAAVSMTSPRIDGKEFFRQARARLSYEQFSHFLVAIKELNAGRSSREDTLASARALFGASNADLYGLFEGLLMRHVTSL